MFALQQVLSFYAIHIAPAVMTVTGVKNPTSWFLLLFSLSSKQASKRVEVWRKLKRIGALPFRGSGYLLPATPANQEHFEWLAESIRKLKGEASVVELVSIDDVPEGELKKLFNEARSKDYEALLKEIRRSSRSVAHIFRLRRKLQEISEIDFFGCPLRARTETALTSLENPPTATKAASSGKRGRYKGRIWVTRPRPGIDRVSSAWLISNYIDKKAKFEFTNDPDKYPECVPFDMFNVGGFTHEGDHCTFETLCKEFGVKDRKIKALAEIIHDADLSDAKFGRDEGIGLDRVLSGWAQMEFSDHDLLHMGMQLIEGLYRSIR